MQTLLDWMNRPRTFNYQELIVLVLFFSVFLPLYAVMARQEYQRILLRRRVRRAAQTFGPGGRELARQVLADPDFAPPGPKRMGRRVFLALAPAIWIAPKSKSDDRWALMLCMNSIYGKMSWAQAEWRPVDHRVVTVDYTSAYPKELLP